MKHIIQISVLMIVVAFFGCTKDTGIPGSDPIDKYLGAWSVSDNALKINYEVTVDRSSSNSSMILLNNFADSGDAAEGLVVGNSVVVSYQQIGQGWFVNGTGTYISDTKVSFNYTLDIGGTEENRMAIFTK